MAFNRLTAANGASAFGTGGEPISLAATDFTVPETAKGVVVVAAGNVVLRTLKGAADITITDAPVGWIPPWHCLAIRKTGTTATLATIEG